MLCLKMQLFDWWQIYAKDLVVALLFWGPSILAEWSALSGQSDWALAPNRRSGHLDNVAQSQLKFVVGHPGLIYSYFLFRSWPILLVGQPNVRIWARSLAIEFLQGIGFLALGRLLHYFLSIENLADAVRIGSCSLLQVDWLGWLRVMI